MTYEQVEYKVSAQVISQIRDIVTAAEAAIQELISQAMMNGREVGPKEAQFYQNYCQVVHGADDELDKIF